MAKKGLVSGGESTSHASGNDIKYDVVETGEEIYIEGDEYHLCKAAMLSTGIHEYVQKTNKEILDDIYTKSSCMIKEGTANTGDFIICKLAVRDKTKRNRTGTISEIISLIQSENGCKVVNASSQKKEGGKIDKVDLDFYPTTAEHAKEYGLEAKNPLYVNCLINKKNIEYINRYAKANGHDIIFGKIAKNGDADLTKNWLHDNGYAINAENNDFHKVILAFKDGGEIDSDTYNKWKSLVNMSKGELEKFYNSEEGKEAGLSKGAAQELGISYGRESARWIMKMKDTPVSEWTPEMWKWAKKQIGFISRMSFNKGALYDNKGRKTRKHTSLLIWGHNPEKYSEGGKIKGGLADKYSLADIAKKHKVSFLEILKEHKKGIEVEIEHTSDKAIASEIAKDHIFENPNYYTLMKKIKLTTGGSIGFKVGDIVTLGNNVLELTKVGRTKADGFTANRKNYPTGLTLTSMKAASQEQINKFIEEAYKPEYWGTKPQYKKIEKLTPIRELGTGAKVYFETKKIRLNEHNGKYLLNVYDSSDMLVPRWNLKFDDFQESMDIAKKISETYPTGVPEAVLLEKWIDKLKNGQTSLNPMNSFIVTKNSTPYGIDRAIRSYLVNGESEQFRKDLEIVKANPNYNTPEKFRREVVSLMTDWQEWINMQRKYLSSWVQRGGDSMADNKKYKEDMNEIDGHELLIKAANNLLKSEQTDSEKPLIVYTTAPESYDGFGTKTLEVTDYIDDKGKPVRKVEIPFKNIEWQKNRYLSGNYAPFEEDKFNDIITWEYPLFKKKVMETTTTEQPVSELDRLKKELANAERLMAKPSFTGDVTPEINRMKAKIAELEGEGTTEIETNNPYADFLIDKIEVKFKEKFPNDKFERAALVQSWLDEVERRGRDEQANAQKETIYLSYFPESERAAEFVKLQNEFNSQKYNYSKPLKQTDVTILETYKDENKTIIRFEWNNGFYEWKYSSTGSGGGIHIGKYQNKLHLLNPLTVAGTHETIYNTWNTHQTTPEGRYIEHSIMKWDKNKLSNTELPESDDTLDGLRTLKNELNIVDTQLREKAKLKLDKQTTTESNSAFKGFDYSYENPYALNKAIEAFLDTNQSAISSEAKQFIRRYTGYGGLGEFGASITGSGLLYEFYTPDLIIKKMWGLAYKYGYKNGSVLEPACGTGEMLKYAPKDVMIQGYEINPYSTMIAEILYPQASITKQYFEQVFIEKNNTIKGKLGGLPKYDLVMMNPPYGSISSKDSKYLPMGEQEYTKAVTYAEYFITRGLDLLEDGGLMVAIIGAELKNGGTLFLDGKITKAKQEIAEKSELLDAYRLPSKIFERTGVTTEIIVLKKV